MKGESMKIRKSVAAIALAGSALFVATACSSEDVDEATSKVSTAVESAASEVSTAAGDAIDEVTGLSNSKAQDILRKAVDPATPPADEIDSVVDTTDPATKPRSSPSRRVRLPPDTRPRSTP